MINMNLKYFRKAILLIHGFAGGNYDYGEIGNDLELYSNFDVYTFTLPGHEKMIIDKVTKRINQKSRTRCLFNRRRNRKNNQ